MSKLTTIIILRTMTIVALAMVTTRQGALIKSGGRKKEP